LVAVLVAVLVVVAVLVAFHLSHVRQWAIDVELDALEFSTLFASKIVTATQYLLTDKPESLCVTSIAFHEVICG